MARMTCLTRLDKTASQDQIHMNSNSGGKGLRHSDEHSITTQPRGENHQPQRQSPPLPFLSSSSTLFSASISGVPFFFFSFSFSWVFSLAFFVPLKHTQQGGLGFIFMQLPSSRDQQRPSSHVPVLQGTFTGF